jgi:pyruvate dehydrogenase E1 component
MFGFQRIGDLLWAAGDMRCRGFLLGATAGRTTLAGEGLQHQDGNSHVLALPHPTVRAYDPAFAYELVLIIEDGLKRMATEPVLYYLTLGNEPYPMPALPEGAKAGVLKGLYRFKPSSLVPDRARVELLGSGAIMNQVLKAQEILETQYGIAAAVWSVTSYKELLRDAAQCERWNMLHPDQERRVSHVTASLGSAEAVVAASDYVKALPLSIARWLPDAFIALGTDGFGRSDGRAALRDFFEVDHRFVVVAALSALAQRGDLDRGVVMKAMADLEINPDKVDPLTA